MENFGVFLGKKFFGGKNGVKKGGVFFFFFFFFWLKTADVFGGKIFFWGQKFGDVFFG